MTIKDFRLSQNLSQNELAVALGISVSTERSYEYGVREPSVKVIEKIKEVYGVDLNAPETAVEETPAKPKRGRKKAAVEAAPAVEEKTEMVEEAPVKPKRGRKKKDATPAVEAAPAKPKRGRKKKDATPAVEAAPAKPKRGRKKAEPAPVDESLLKMQNDAEAAVHALFTPGTAVIIQSPMGGEIDVNEILEKVGPVDKVYVRVDQNAAYWVRGDESGAVNLW